MQTHKKEHSIGNCVFDEQSQITEWKLLKKDIKINDIFEWQKIISFEIKCQWNEHFQFFFADSSYAAHADIKSHTGSAMIFDKGTIISKSIKQKISTKITTEA